jgi:hypothetical protein
MWIVRLLNSHSRFLARKIMVLATFIISIFSLPSYSEQQDHNPPSVDLYNLSLEELMDIRVN